MILVNIYNNVNSINAQIISIEILSNDRIGLVGELSSVITAFGADIRGHSARTFVNDKARAMSLFKVSILTNGVNVDTLLHRLGKVKGVISITVAELR